LTDDKKDLEKLGKFLKKLSYIERFEFLPYHKLGVQKYKKLNLKYRISKINEPSAKSLEIARRNAFGK
jgi:pyruvate formate lyase activating enzyme